MPRLYSSREVIRALERAGFAYVSQRGSHVKYRKAGSPTRTAIVPADRKEIPRGTLRSILRQSGLDEHSLLRS